MADDDGGLRRTLRHGAICYLQIPADDLSAAGAFYAKVFGWEPEAGHPESFMAPGLLGQFIARREAAGDDGVLIWISVDDLAAALAAVVSAGGELAEATAEDGTERLLATVRDPAGNELGLVQHLARPGG